MSYVGRVHNGVVVVENGAALPPDGTLVRIEPVEGPAPASLTDKLLAWAGQGIDLPADLAANHDHYLHGQERR